MRFNDAVPGIVIIAFALAVIAYAQTFPQLHGQSYGPDLFPTLIGSGLIICGLVLIGMGMAKRATQPWVAVGAWARERGRILDVLLVPATLLIYILFSDMIGFVPIAVTIMTLLLIRFGSSLVTSLVVAIVTTLAIQLMFAKVLLVPLPWGLLQPVAW